MNVQIVARSQDVTNRERNYAEEKVNKLPRFFDQIHRVEVILEKDKERAMAEVIVSAGKDHTFVAKEVADTSLAAAIDLVVDKLERQIKKYKEQLQDHRRGEQLPEEDMPAPEETYEDVVREEY